MKTQHLIPILFLAAFCTILIFPRRRRAGQYTNFDVSIYIPVSVVRNLDNPAVLSNQWDRISRQLKVDKVISRRSATGIWPAMKRWSA